MEDRFTQIPRDIRELILYETQPTDLDTLCQINQQMEDLCHDDRILDNYLNYYQLNV